MGPRRSYGSRPFILRGGYVYQSMSSFSQISTYAFKLQNLAFHSFCCVSRNYYIHIHRYDHLQGTNYRLGLVLEQKIEYLVENEYVHTKLGQPVDQFILVFWSIKSNFILSQDLNDFNRVFFLQYNLIISIMAINRKRQPLYFLYILLLLVWLK